MILGCQSKHHFGEAVLRGAASPEAVSLVHTNTMVSAWKQFPRLPLKAAALTGTRLHVKINLMVSDLEQLFDLT